MKNFNYELSDEQIKFIQKVIFVWLKLCALEDNLENILKFLKSKDYEKAIISLKNKRTFKVEDHPLWLVFEVEGGIQIREEQYELITQILDNPRVISQLEIVI
jgi:hypothetical protein